jgi:GTP pyrophosphokinase
MVSVRKSHQVVSVDFKHWLAEQSLSVAKVQSLEHLWGKVAPLYRHQEVSLLKSMEMVEILSSLNLDADSLSAAFLTPLSEESLISSDFIEEHFSHNIAMLCRGVEKMAAIKGLRQQGNSGNVDNIRRMLLAMVEDVRAVVIKLAERLCDLREQKNNDEETRVLAAKESANIYAPLANRLGIGQLKWELEDISFRYLHPQVYKKIAKLLDETRLEREKYMNDFVSGLNHQLKLLQING